MDTFTKKLITVLMAAFLLCYVGYQGFQIFYSPIETETVYDYSMYETVDTEGIAIRREKPITQEVDGYIFYTAENGSRVSKSGDIAHIYASEEEARTRQLIAQLEDEITLLRQIESQGNTNRVNLEIINKQIDTSLNDLIGMTHSASFNDMYSLHSKLMSLINKRQITIGKADSFKDRIDVLTEEKNALSAGLSEAAPPSITSPDAGYFVSHMDGFENAVDVDKITEITPGDVTKVLESTPQDVAPDTVGKVVGDYEWYLLCVLPVEKTANIHAGASLTIKLPFVLDDPVPVTVASVNRNRGQDAAVVFKCNYMSKELSSIRKEPIQIQVQQHEGLRVPATAIRTNDDNETGVFIRVGNAVAFRKVVIEYSTANYSICKEVSKIKAENKDESVVIKENEYLKLYDDIIVGGKGIYDGQIIR